MHIGERLFVKDKIFSFIPLGRADLLLEEFIGENLEKNRKEFQEYETALAKYRNLKLFQIIIKILLYAGVITSIVASLGFEQIRIISQIASYIGVTFLLFAYVITNYFTMIYREEYHVRREILVSQTEIRQEKQE